MTISKKEIESNIEIAASDFRGALEEVIYLAVQSATSGTGGGERHEQSKIRFSRATLMLWRAMNGKSPRDE